MSIVLAPAFCLMLFSCVKELDRQEHGFADGDCDVAFELHGMPLQSALTRTAGNAIRDIDNLYVLFYSRKADGYELSYAFTSDPACGNSVFAKGLDIVSRKNEGRTPGTDLNPGDGEWDGVAESTTQNVTTGEVQVKRGSYEVYVVANVDHFSSSSLKRSEIDTPEKLRGYSLVWNDTIKDNDAMFGFFTDEGPQVYDVINQTAPLVRFTANEKTLHAWVKRAVSKVTVAFDGSKLRDGVRVYIKSVTIHDIPANCKLGADNSPGPTAKFNKNGESIVYTTGAGVTNATRISAQEPYFPNFSGLAENKEDVEKWKKNAHSENTDALYFFENLQGKSSGAVDANGSWKQQTDTDGNGIPDDRDHGIVKDTKTQGTYIEVVAYYQNDNFGAKTEGDIRYRFMLGKNTTDDFNAERNNHYKLTMCFKNNANDVDWHIDYTDKEDIYIPDTIYVSYEYNTPSMLPIRIVGDQFTSLNVKITESHWYADDNTVRAAGFPSTTTDPNGIPVGFFSLSYDENPRVGTNEEGDAAVTMINNYWQKQPTYAANGESGTTNKNQERQYIRDGKKVRWSDLEAHGYDIITRKNSDGKTVFEANIPLFTRPLIICKWASWTGANPYYSSSRSGKIQLTGTLSGKPYNKTINVIQVPRIENPSGIYRRHDNTDEFNVTLMERAGEMYNSSISYAPYESKGLWRAVIYRSTTGKGNDVGAWFTLAAGSQKADAVGEYIQGDKDELIKFTFKPNGVIGQNQIRCGIIKVEYNDYTCTHYIFVRQGYAPMQLEDGKVYWHTFNLYSGSAETSHPCEAGSFFIRGRLATAILDSNTAGFGVAVNSLNAITTTNGTTPGTVTIETLKSYTRSAFSSGTQNLGNNNKTYNPWTSGRVPTAAEWGTLKNANADALIDKGFGVLYGDGSKSTQTDPTEAYGCLHSDVGSDGKTTKGMRGCFVYNTSDGRNIFLPIGALGYGRRKVGSSGELQYSFGNTYFKYNVNTLQRALLYNLDTNEGAIYWARAQVGVSGLGFANTNSWDINYKTYDFDYMDASANTTPACYIRLVQTAAPQ